MNLKLFEKSKELYISYDKIYRDAKSIYENLFKLVLVLLFLMFGFIGNVEVDPNASIKLAIMECSACLVLLGICTYFINRYQDIAEEYKDKASKEYMELID